MRPSITRAILFVVCAAGSSGCFTSHVLVTVRPDGSGTVEQTATIRPADLLAFDKLASPDLAANAQNRSDIARQFQKDAGKADQGWLVGGNLRLRATRPINTADTTGWAITYDFDDVTGLRLQLLPQIPGLQGFYGIATKDPTASTRLTTMLEPLDVENPSTRISGQQNQPAPPPPADTEIFLASLLVKGDKLAIGAPVNITNSPGYDNQPSFTPDGNRILFASVRGSLSAPRDRNAPAEPRTPATDIFRYDIASRGISRITNTPEGEFSPAVMPDGKNLSVVRVESDGTQRLWRIAAEKTNDESSIILRDIKPVGYYAWIDERTLALYVLGQGDKPSTLQVAEPQTGKSQVVAIDIGRSIQRMPSGHVSFVARQPSAASNAPVLHRLFNTADSAGFGTEPLTSVPSGVSEPYVVWLPDGSALLAADTTLYRWRRGETSWTAVANLAAFGLHGVTRLAISPKGDRLAIVAPAK